MGIARCEANRPGAPAVASAWMRRASASVSVELREVTMDVMKYSVLLSPCTMHVRPF